MDESYTYMAMLVHEDQPKNPKELNGLIGDFLTDGMQYNEKEAVKLCEVLYKTFMDQSLLNTEQRDTIIAEKLTKPITISSII
jgi:hypothetical protein